MRVGRRHIVGLLLVVLALQAAGCPSGWKKPKWLSGQKQLSGRELRVEQRVGGQAVNLTADEIVRIMRRVGLVDEQILNLGPGLRDALRATGAAALTSGGQPEVMLAVSDEHLFVQSRGQSIFIYDLKEKKFIPVPPMPTEVK
ncbi:MAG: hypothetical protein JW955_21140 [Sedimentisphaerales bacterium]|nr:hypothetical protein [Sedimentisphaerales bacterium]